MPGAWSTMVVQVHAGPLTALLKVLLVLALLIPPSVGPAWSPRRRVPLPMLFCVVERRVPSLLDASAREPVNASREGWYTYYCT
jgi:hypothetical protein